MGDSDKRKASQKEAAKRRPQTWKKGQSGNPAGAPRRGESWAEIITRIGKMTPKEAATRCRKVAGRMASVGDGVTLKEAVVLSVYATLLFEPSPGLFNAMMDRVDGRPAQSVDVTSDGEPIRFKEIVVRVNGPLEDSGG